MPSLKSTINILLVALFGILISFAVSPALLQHVSKTVVQLRQQEIVYLNHLHTRLLPPQSRPLSQHTIVDRLDRRLSNDTSNTKLTATSMGRSPVVFLSHGGPNVMEDTLHPAYNKLQEIGREITTKVKPKAVVVFSAHWQGGRDTVEVNTAESMDLIYDFYGFPAHYYEFKYPNRGSPALAQKLLEHFKKAGIKAEGVRRGLDHGVWASFMCAFNPEENPLNVPIVQVSLFDSDDPDQHYRLGQAVEGLRDEGIQIIVSGMAVHNLRDLGRWMGRPGAADYTKSFDEALRAAVEQPPESRQKAMAELLKRPDARKAHPSFEHLLPIYIGAGAAGNDTGKRSWTLAEGSTSWAQYRFGEYSA